MRIGRKFGTAEATLGASCNLPHTMTPPKKLINPFPALNQSLLQNPYDTNLIPKLLRQFIKQNQNPRNSPNYLATRGSSAADQREANNKKNSTTDHDSYDQLLTIASLHSSNTPLQFLILKTLKILMRKHVNRKSVRGELLAYLRHVLEGCLLGEDGQPVSNQNHEHAPKDSEHVNTESHCDKQDATEKTQADQENQSASLNLNGATMEASTPQNPSGTNQSESLDETISTQSHSNNVAIPPPSYTTVNENLACEAANVLLNICFAPFNVLQVVEQHLIPPLLNLLRCTEKKNLQAAISGAIQSICFVKEGKQRVIQEGGVEVLTPLATSTDSTVRARVIGSLHNLSSDFFIAIKLRDAGLIPHLIELLKDESQLGKSLVASCAGCIQNLSREDKARKIIRDSGGVEPLVSLLFSKDIFVQKCSAAALLNIIGTELSDLPDHPKRKAFKEILSCAIAVGSMADVMCIQTESDDAHLEEEGDESSSNGTRAPIMPTK